MKNVELLSPAGNYESFLGAINAGADAVYLGGTKFGARAYADNFTEDEICKAIFYAHLFQKKVYLTVNTLMKNPEMDELYDYLSPFYEAGLDGVIVQDLGVFMFIREHFPHLALHVSTQMTITGVNGAKLLKELRAERIVPARELSLEEIIKMKQETGLEIETFIHGAMCYCYSGQCLFSSILGGRSGNRGRCAGPCRLPYQIGTDKKNDVEYPLSLKDMCTLEILPDLIEAGIDSFKIEGRMKKPEYAAGVTSIYRKYIDLYQKKGRNGYQVDKKDLEQLYSLYIRSDIQNGYYRKYNGKEMITLKSPAYNGADEALLLQIRERYLSRDSIKKIKVGMEASFQIGEEATLRVWVKETPDKKITVRGIKVQAAAKTPVTAQNITDSLKKLGDTFFFVEDKDIRILLDRDCFYPLKMLNDLRRNAILQLQDSLMKKRVLNSFEPSDTIKIQSDVYNNKAYSILVQEEEQLKAVLESSFDFQILYLESDIKIAGETLSYEMLCRMKAKRKDIKIIIALPFVCRDKDIRKLDEDLPEPEKLDGFLVRNLESYYWLKEKGITKEKIFFDAGIYAFNRYSMKLLDTFASTICIPYELNKKEQFHLLEEDIEASVEKVVYGKVPLMVSANCIAKTTNRCPVKDNNILTLKDRYGKEFPVKMHCKYCYNVLYNSVPLFIPDIKDYKTVKTMRIQFTTESVAEVRNILDYYANDYEGKRLPVKEYTTGHEKRGVQ